MRQFYVLLAGIYFGIVLVKSEVVSWFRIQSMFRFQEAHMYLIIGSAVMVGAVSVWLIKRFQMKTVEGREIHLVGKAFNKGTVIGGIMFGMGWAITGACPGPIYAQIGAGSWIAIVTLLSALTGAYLHARLHPHLPR